MGWSIQHIAGPSTNRSYSNTRDGLDLAASVLPPGQAKALDILRIKRADCWFETTPKQAAAIRDALTEAVRIMRWRPMLRSWRGFLAEIADAADIAARSGRPWEWH